MITLMKTFIAVLLQRPLNRARVLGLNIAWLGLVAIFALLFAACQGTNGEVTPTLPPAPISESTAEMVTIATPSPTVPIATALPPESSPEMAVTMLPSRPVSIVIEGEFQLFLPLQNLSQGPTPTPTETPAPTATPTIDFKAVLAQLQSEGHDLGFAKIGFHAGGGGNRNGIGDWMRRLDAAGVPFFIKSADDAGPLVEAQQILRGSQVPHTLIYRRSGNEYDTPKYDLPPEEAARDHWQLHMDAFPPELDPNLVWIETINEVDRNRSEWLGRFALETARLAQVDGFRWAAFGWASGEPEISDWQSPSMLAFLRLAGENPDRLAIALHEYSYIVDDIAHEYPHKLGRFQQLYQVTDQQGIPRPIVLISEWGWEYQQVPGNNQALQDINWAAELYAPYPEIKGAAIWYLGGGFARIADQAQKLIVPVTEYSLGNYFPIPLPPDQISINPEQYRP